MCGITGWLYTPGQEPAPEALAQMAQPLAIRVPMKKVSTASQSPSWRTGASESLASPASASAGWPRVLSVELINKKYL